MVELSGPHVARRPKLRRKLDHAPRRSGDSRHRKCDSWVLRITAEEFAAPPSEGRALGGTTSTSSQQRLRSMPTAPSSLTTPVVLVVDDEPTVLRLMARTLLEAGYAVHQASNGPDASHWRHLNVCDHCIQCLAQLLGEGEGFRMASLKPELLLQVLDLVK